MKYFIIIYFQKLDYNYLNMFQDEEEFFDRKPKTIQSDSVQFKFPDQQVLFNHYQTLNEARLLINTIDNPERKFIWTCRLIKRKYLYLRCKYCLAFITLKLEQRVKVLKYNIEHVHPLLSFKKRQQQKIQAFIEKLPNNCHPSYIKQLVIHTFSISSRRFYYIYDKKFKKKSYEQIQNILIEKGYDCLSYYGQGTNFPELFIYASPQMLQLFQLYGDLVLFDVTYNLIKQKTIQNRQYGIGIFSGLDNNLRVVVFGVALICKQTTQSFIKLFQGFLKIYPKCPSTFITDQQHSIGAALKYLKDNNSFSGYHAFDTYHILKNLRKKAKKTDISYCRYLIKARNKQSFQNTIQKALNNEVNEQILEEFVKRSQKYCFSQLPPSFVGFSCSNSSSEKINDLIKSFIPHEVNFWVFFIRMQKFMKHILNNLNNTQIQSKKYQQLFQDFSIQQMRVKLEKRIFQKFLCNYTKGLRLQCDQISEQIFVCYNSKQKWKVDNYICGCEMRQKTGLPCEHLIKVLWFKGEFNYIKYVSIRWIKQIKVIQNRGRPKFSRKNILK